MKLEQALSKVPESVRDMMDLIGLEATEKLVKAMGGVTFPFGKGNHETERSKKLRQVVGDHHAQVLTEHYSGEDFYLPRCHEALHTLKRVQFCEDVQTMQEVSGLSVTRSIEELCPKYQISDRTAWKWWGDRA